MFSRFRTFDALSALQEVMDVSRNMSFFNGATTCRGAYPTVNIFEKNGDLVLVAELPGVKKEDLKVEVKGNTLRLAGERNIDYGKDISYHRVERNSSKFDRTLKLPVNVEPDQVKAEFKDGILVISLSRAESDKPKQITVN